MDSVLGGVPQDGEDPLATGMQLGGFMLFFPVTATILLALLFIRVWRTIGFADWRRHEGVKRGKQKNTHGCHSWRPYRDPGLQFCSICRKFLVGIWSFPLVCNVCGYGAHSRCSRSAPDNCKEVAKPERSPDHQDSDSESGNHELHTHQWMEGNLGLDAFCCHCGNSCGSVWSLNGMKCLWCQRTAHRECTTGIAELACDLGRHRRLIVPRTRVRRRPETTSNVTMMGVESRKGKKHRIHNKSAASMLSAMHTAATAAVRRIGSGRSRNINPEYQISSSLDSSPLLVFVNGKSGGQQGQQLLRYFNQLLNPIQVCDIAEDGGPERGLALFSELGARFRILVCGGDGTVGWVLGVIDTFQFESPPPVAVLPLGTGNDLAQVLGWGKGYAESGVEPLSDYLEEVESAHVVMLDRWRVAVTADKQQGRGRRRRSSNGQAESSANSGRTKLHQMNNYFGIGVDAKVCFEFHEMRKKNSELFVSRAVNRIWYSQFGAKDIFERSCRDLPKKLEISLDGQPLDISNLEGIMFLNISSYAGGVDMWATGESGPDDVHEPASMQDQLLEVVGIYSSFHMGTIVGGLAQPVRLGQCRVVEIKATDTIPMQVDGEPWIQSPCVVRISHKTQSLMLARSMQASHSVMGVMGEVLDWAEGRKVISMQQRDIILREMSRRVRELKHES